MNAEYYRKIQVKIKKEYEEKSARMDREIKNFIDRFWLSQLPTPTDKSKFH